MPSPAPASPSALPSAAEETYVATYPLGSDANECTRAAPCATVGRALQHTARMGRVNVAAGVYAERISLDFDQSVTIQGAGQDRTVFDGRWQGQVAFVPGGATLQLADLTVFRGSGSRGGAISNYGNLTIVRTLVTASLAAELGGGIASSGELTVKDSTITGNQSTNQGGGISTSGGGNLTMSGSTVQNNVVVPGNSEMFEGFFQPSGAGLFIAHRADIRSSTFADNYLPYGRGGAIFNAYWLDGSHVTVFNNYAGQGGGLFTWNRYTNTGTELEASLLINNVGGNCESPGNMLGGDNRDDDGTCPIAVAIAQDRSLGPVQANGGPTATLALIAASPAHGAVPDGYLCDGTDQRGVPRRYDNSTTCDVGAYQLVDPDPASPSPSATHTS